VANRLKTELTIAKLEQLARAKNHTQAAKEMQEAKRKQFAEI
jgi:hypothetical protein